MDPNPALEALKTARAEFEKLVHEMRPELHRYCARMTGSVIDGEDVVQDTLAKAFYLLPQTPQIANLRSWIFRIATAVWLAIDAEDPLRPSWTPCDSANHAGARDMAPSAHDSPETLGRWTHLICVSWFGGSKARLFKRLRANARTRSCA